MLLDNETSQPLVGKVNEREKYHLFPGVYKDRYAMKVAGALTNEDE
ncbi:MAG: hypothetical protein HKL91_06130 [Candidatus Eremiobacteraeota bacterium]|nr:hypothetical protein [Candidatus Eremiobacteraeota bacterium]